MGPRHFSRGIGLGCALADRCMGLLQWGHGISAVELVLGQLAVRQDILEHIASASVQSTDSVWHVHPSPPYYSRFLHVTAW